MTTGEAEPAYDVDLNGNPREHLDGKMRGIMRKSWDLGASQPSGPPIHLLWREHSVEGAGRLLLTKVYVQDSSGTRANGSGAQGRAKDFMVQWPTLSGTHMYLWYMHPGMHTWYLHPGVCIWHMHTCVHAFLTHVFWYIPPGMWTGFMHPHIRTWLAQACCVPNL